MRPLRQEPNRDAHHGSHTLRVWTGTVVGLFGNDVFVELGPRMQGVIARDHFARPPAVGSQHEFTLRGLEEGLWSLSLSTEKSLETWQQMEIGSLVQARCVRVAPGGLEVKIGALHGFLPKSHTGLPRDQRPDPLVGKVFTVEVIEIDSERQRVTVSRKLVVQRERDDDHQREVDRLKIGQVVQGRVTRIEDYGAFAAFGHGMEGLIHVSNLAHERVAHPSAVVKQGDVLELKVLHVRRGGKRIGLGLKQMRESPWTDLERTAYAGQIVLGLVTRVREFGVFVAIRPGVEGLVPVSECGLGPTQRLSGVIQEGAQVSVRILEIDVERQRMALSFLHVTGARIAPEEAENAETFAGLAQSLGLDQLERPLGDELGRALRRDAG
ncbi:MAG: 30S ribosomal protein S1 [Planctomycetes bacterium]|nr:30S ribosomal protein S1 [Planctomycetota bacterium]